MPWKLSFRIKRSIILQPHTSMAEACESKCKMVCAFLYSLRDSLICPGHCSRYIEDSTKTCRKLFFFLSSFSSHIFEGLQYFKNNITALIRTGKPWMMLMPLCMATSCLWYPSWTDVLVGAVAVGQDIMILN